MTMLIIMVKLVVTMNKTIKAMTTMAVDNLLCMKNGGTEWTIVSCLKK